MPASSLYSSVIVVCVFLLFSLLLRFISLVVFYGPFVPEIKILVD